MDIVFLRDLRIDTVVGAWDWERRIRQVVSLDLEMAWDISRAGREDELEYTLDYKAVAKRLIAFVEGSNFKLVEALAESVARVIVTEFGVGWVRVTLNKPGAVRSCRDAGVIIERRTEDYTDA